MTTAKARARALAHKSPKQGIQITRRESSLRVDLIAGNVDIVTSFIFGLIAFYDTEWMRCTRVESTRLTFPCVRAHGSHINLITKYEKGQLRHGSVDI